MRPLYIFDLDGTLALTEHRQHILDNKDDQQRWQKFFAACVDDHPNLPVIQTLKTLRRAIELGYRDFRYMKEDHDLDSIRHDPRFRQLMREYENR